MWWGRDGSDSEGMGEELIPDSEGQDDGLCDKKGIFGVDGTKADGNA
jgi:hypothetical protein